MRQGTRTHPEPRPTEGHAPSLSRHPPEIPGENCTPRSQGPEQHEGPCRALHSLCPGPCEPWCTLHPPTLQSQTCPGKGCRGTEHGLGRALPTAQSVGLLYANPSPPRPASGKARCWSSVGRCGGDERHSSWSWADQAPAFTLRAAKGPQGLPSTAAHRQVLPVQRQVVPERQWPRPAGRSPSAVGQPGCPSHPSHTRRPQPRRTWAWIAR